MIRTRRAFKRASNCVELNTGRGHYIAAPTVYELFFAIAMRVSIISLCFLLLTSVLERRRVLKQYQIALNKARENEIALARRNLIIISMNYL